MEATYYYVIAAAITFVALVFSLIVSIVSLRKVHKQIVIANLREYSKSYREILQKLPLGMFEEKPAIELKFDE